LHRQAVAIAEEGSELAQAAGLRARPLPAGVGVSWQSILAVAESEDARLIVTGADDVRGARVSFGSISRGVTHHARVPVLVVPPPSESVSSSVIPADAPRASDPPVPVDPAVPAARSTLARTISRLTGSAREDALARYVMLEAGKGRDLADILGDSYIENRADRVAIQALLDRRDVVDALGRDATDDLRARIAALG
jgi:Universal stress protein family